MIRPVRDAEDVCDTEGIEMDGEGIVCDDEVL